MKRMTRPPRRRILAASSIAVRTSLTPERTAERAMSLASPARAIRRASVVFPVPGGPHKNQRGQLSLRPQRLRQKRFSTDQPGLAHELIEGSRPHTLGER